ncbi:MAG: hypothetical protein H0W69_05320 [Gemmatimonadaceae bacterium]|nr:hypothetical protein [Gemmatimonadaceae bacterium]
MALAIMTILGAIVLPSVSSYLDREQVTESAATLDSLRVSIGRFRTATTDYPGRLSHLSKLIKITPLPADLTGCNTAANSPQTAYVAASVTGWLNNGPFWDRSIPRTGFVLPIGTVRDSMTRTSVSTVAGTLVMTIPGVTIEDARELNLVEDGPLDVDQVDGSNTTGTVRFTLPASSSTVTYHIPVGVGC